jgi:FtsP/CotA-like multicopper oxidase with cupredoxin domain
MNNCLRNTIQQILLVSSAAAFSASALAAAVGPQLPPPGPGQVPDYFGVVPNYSNSPQPVLATATITDPSGVGAVAAATTYNYVTGAYTGGIADIQIVSPGSGYSPAPTVTITGGVGAIGAAATAHVNGILGFTISSGGSGYSVAPAVILSNPDIVGGIQATAVATFGGLYGDSVTGIQIVNAGSGYTTLPSVLFTPAAVDVGVIDAIATPLFNPVAGKITSVSVDLPGTGYNTPIAGPGIHKFVDSLPGLNAPNLLGQELPIAVPDTVTFPGSDYYEINESEYTQQLHSELQATHLRGYKQINIGTALGCIPPVIPIPAVLPVGTCAFADNTVVPPARNQYLGPIIVAKRDRPVRIKLVNNLSTGAAGNLPLPVDTTYMGSTRAIDTPNRTALHLHGGNTPWISDGTPRQTVKPVGELGPNKGESARDVPDMWFDVAGVLLPNSPTCTQGTTVCATPGATNNPGDGSLTFFYTNEQSARLMFYHDHAEGLTRLNVYDGLAAGYVLQDPTEQAMIMGGTAQAAAALMGYSAADQVKYDASAVYPAATLPPLADTIPLIIQEKTFVPNNTIPVLNYYGAFASQLNSQDPTWRWGSGVPEVAGTYRGPGDLWVPHVFMPNQNPGDISAANAMGRYDYGPWFHPPFVGIEHGAIANPYFDPACVSSLTQYCEGPTMPGTPNGNTYTVANLPAGYDPQIPSLGSPSATPEAFNDTPLVNGTAYPVLKVDPKKYRLRLLSAGNDRVLNLSLVVAASKLTDTTKAANFGPVASHQAVPCDGVATYPAGHAFAGLPPVASDCTEIKAVPFDSTQAMPGNTPFPAHWYTVLNGGITYDGRPSGVFDPATRGPAMVQIGTEGGFLSSPAVIKNQPINFEYNGKNIVVTNVKEHALLLGPAERADVVVDFSKFAGSTLILYNDAPAPIPAFELRIDYYTGDADNTNTGGAFSTLPGYGPNTRTLMQIQVAAACVAGIACDSSHPVDYVDGINSTGTLVRNGWYEKLSQNVQKAFKTSQEPIIVPQVAYNAAYGTAVTDGSFDPSVISPNANHNLSTVSDNWLTYHPIDPVSLIINPVPVRLEFQPKTIIEDWTRDYGRMNSMLGTEIPRTTANVANAIPQAYIDPPTELVKLTPNDGSPITGTLADGTQLWKITHNGVDSHAMHFHLFHVQLINRIGWDGAIRQPSANEFGWKDTVMMHPLENVVVALRPKTMTQLPFKVPNSHRTLDTSGVVNAAGLPPFFNFNPLNGNPVVPPIANVNMNYGWEYVWHCHLLGHEENDMMRAIAVAHTPETPSGLTLTAPVAPAVGVRLDWVDNSIISNWVTIQRATDAAFVNDNSVAVGHAVTTINTMVPECASQAGCIQTYTDLSAVAGNGYFYRLMANNTVGGGNGRADVPVLLDGTYGGFLPPEVAALTPGFTGYANVTASSAFSNTASLAAPLPLVTVTPASLAFLDQGVGTISAAQTVKVTNVGLAPLAITSVAFTAPVPAAVVPAVSNFVISSNTCPVAPAATLAPGASCNIGVTFNPTATSLANGLTDTLTITDNTGGVAGTTQAVTLTGTGIVPLVPIATVTGPLTFLNQVVETLSPVQTVTLSNTGGAPLSISNIAISAPFVLQPGTCGASLAPAASCAINVAYKPTTLINPQPGTLTITDNSSPAVAPVLATQVVILTGNSIVQLNAPLNLKAVTTSTNGRNITLSWTDTSHGETGYVVQRATINVAGVLTSAYTNASCTPAITAVANAASCNTSAPASDQRYSYQVFAINGAVAPVVNGPATTIKVSTLRAPNNWAGVTGAVAGTTRPTWVDNSTIESSYTIQHCTAAGNTAAVTTTCNSAAGVWTNATPATLAGTPGTGGMSIIDTGLTTGRPYRYRIVAVDNTTGSASMALSGSATAR